MRLGSPLRFSDGTSQSSAALVGRYLLPTGSFVETFPRKLVTSNAVGTTSGQFRGELVEMAAGQVVTSLSFMSGTTAVASPTHQWFGLLDSTGKVLAVTSDDTTTAWAASSAKTLTLTSPYTVATTGAYYIGRCVVATTMPTSAGTTNFVAVTGLTPLAVGVVAGQSGPATVGATLTLASAANVDYGYAS